MLLPVVYVFMARDDITYYVFSLGLGLEYEYERNEMTRL